MNEKKKRKRVCVKRNDFSQTMKGDTQIHVVQIILLEISTNCGIILPFADQIGML